MPLQRQAGSISAIVTLWMIAFPLTVCRADQAPAPDAGGSRPAVPEAGFTRFFNPSTAPFIPVPLIGSDPNSGTTLGILPVWIKTDDAHEIRRIIAPDFLHNPYFGYGVDGRVYAYSSQDAQWSVDAGIKQKVERGIDGEYQVGRLRDQRWSMTYSAIYARSGTPRFYGVGNETRRGSQTNYTNTRELAQVQLGLNLSHAWQILYTGRVQSDDVTAGTLAGIPSIEEIFGQTRGVGTTRFILHRLSVIYDTRSDLVVPDRGAEWILYAGEAAAHGLFNGSLYSEAGVDGRDYWKIAEGTVLAGHVALRYLPTAHSLPFYALSSLGGGESVAGGAQPLRGYGEGRFYDRNSFSATAELRRRVFSFDAVATRVDVEFAPFLDVGRVFGRTSTNPLERLHHVLGVGFRGIARPFVVGKVDVGYGSEGLAIFTGLNYPF